MSTQKVSGRLATVVAFSASAPASGNANGQGRRKIVTPNVKAVTRADILGSNVKKPGTCHPWEIVSMSDDELTRLPLEVASSIQDPRQRRRWEVAILTVPNSRRVLEPDVLEYRLALEEQGHGEGNTPPARTRESFDLMSRIRAFGCSVDGGLNCWLDPELMRHA